MVETIPKSRILPRVQLVFVLYVVDLSVLIHESGYGMKLTPTHILAIILFADDIVLQANTMRELNELKVLPTQRLVYYK